MMSNDNRHRVAAITGGAAGIGLATCREFLERGMAVAIIDRDVDAGRRAADSLQGVAEAGGSNKVISVSADVRDSSAVDAAITSAVEELEGLDVLVNCAGITERAPAAELHSRHYVPPRLRRLSMSRQWRLTWVFHYGCLIVRPRVASRR